MIINNNNKNQGHLMWHKRNMEEKQNKKTFWPSKMSYDAASQKCNNYELNIYDISE